MDLSGLIFDPPDPGKEAGNLEKHKVSFDEAMTVFVDDFSETMPDPEHSLGEERWIVMGMSQQFRLLVVSYTEREGAIRIISARRPTPAEKRAYERD